MAKTRTDTGRVVKRSARFRRLYNYSAITLDKLLEDFLFKFKSEIFFKISVFKPRYFVNGINVVGATSSSNISYCRIVSFTIYNCIQRTL